MPDHSKPQWASLLCHAVGGVEGLRVGFGGVEVAVELVHDGRCQRRELPGSQDQWPSSGKVRSLEGTAGTWTAVKL